MPFGIGQPEVLIFLVVVLLLFGAKRVPEIGRSVGKGMREFKDAVTGKDDEAPPRLPAAEDEERAGARTAARARHRFLGPDETTPAPPLVRRGGDPCRAP